MSGSCAIKVMILCGHVRRDQRALAVLKGHLLPAERQGRISLSDNRSMPPGSSLRELREAMNSADVLVILITPDYFGSVEFRDVVAPAAAVRHEAGDGVIVGVCPFPFDTTGALDWLPIIPVYSKATGRPRPARTDAILADAAGELKVKLGIDDSECTVPRFEQGDTRRAAQDLRLAYQIAGMRRRNPRAVADVDALHAALRRDGEAIAGDLLQGGRFSLLYRKCHHGPLEEWAAFDQQTRTPVRAFLMLAEIQSTLSPQEASLDRLAAATRVFHHAEPGSLVSPLRHEPGLGWSFIAEAVP